MAISDKLLLLNNTKQQIRQAIESLGYTVGDIPFSQYPDVIDSMVVTEGGDLFQHGQALNYNFTNQRYGTRLPDGTITYTTNINELGIFTRASTATYTDAMGVVRTAGVDEPRFDYDPVTGKALGVLIEPSRTNSLVGSTDPTLWSKHRVTVEVGSDPDSFLIREETGTGIHAVSHGDSIQENHTASRGVYLKYAGRQYVAIYNTVSTLSSNVGGVVFDVINGTVASPQPGPDSTIIDAKIEPAGDGWFFAYVITQDDGDWDTASRSKAISVRLSLSPDYSAGGRIYEGDGVSGVLIRYPQYERGSYPTSYIPTTDSPVTRAADDAAIDLSDVFNPDEGTLRITAQVPEGEVVATLGGIDILSDSDELKEYTLTHGDSVSGSELTLGDGIFERVEYFPRVLP